MADLDLWTKNSTLTNFADEMQSIIVSDNRKNLLRTASIEANSVIGFCNSNGLVINADKAVVLYNSKGKCEIITVENVQGAPYVFERFSEAVLRSWVDVEMKCYHIFLTQVYTFQIP